MILKEGTIIKNCNGYNYKVIKNNCFKTLFENVQNNEYVVASYVKKYSDGIEWAWGKYYGNDLKGALKELNKL